MSNPVVAADKFIYGTLTADETLQVQVSDRVYGHVVSEGGYYPLVLFTLPGAGRNVNTLEGTVIYSDMVYAVRMVGKVSDYADLEVGAFAIQQALQKATGSNESGQIISSIYEAPFAMIEIDRDGYEVRHLGCLVRLHVQ